MRRSATAIVLVAAGLGASRAHGYGAGVSGFSGKPPAQSCNDCHSGGVAPRSVTLSGPTTLEAGAQATYTLDVVTGASDATVGFDIAASAGSLGIVAGQPNKSYLDGGEITHTKDWPHGKTVQLTFTLTAPADPAAATLTLFADALESDGSDDTTGDRARATTLDITVEAPPDLAGSVFDLAGPMDLARLDAVTSATAVKPMPVRDLGPPRNEPRWACDCQLAPAAPPPPTLWLWLAPLVLLSLRRRR